MGFVVRSVEFMEEGAQFTFVEVPEDLRANGMLQNRMLLVPERAMPDELQALAEKAQAVLTEAMYLREKSPPADPETMAALHDEDDDAPGPWDNPMERDVPRPPDPPPAPPGQRVG